jgi:autotransporter-associated beta strand protein
MKNNHLVGFNGANGRFLQNIGAAVKHPNHYFEGLTFDPPGPPRSILVNYQIISPPNVGANDPGHPRIWAQVIVDVDGSIAGVPNSSIVSNHPFLLTGSETRPSIWTNMYRSDHRFAQCLLNYGLPSDSNPNISVLRTKPGTRTAGVYYINGFKEHHQLPLIVRDDFLYTYYYESLPSTRTINLSVNDAEVGDHYLVCFKDFGKLPGITASGMTSRTSLAALKASTTSAFFRETNGDFYVRPVATSPFQGHAITWTSNITLPVVDSDGDGVSDGAEAAAGTDPFRAVDGTEPFVNSEFNVPGHFGHWSGFSGIANETVNSGVLAGQTTNTNSQMVENNLRIAGSEVPFLLVRMRASQNGNAQIFWGRLDAPSYVSARSVTVNYSGNNEWRVLTFPMQSNAEWQGQIITNLRFDPTTLSGVDFEVDWIRASTVGPGIKAATGSTLNLDSAWTSAFVPVNPDIATWNAGSLAGAMTLGGPLHWAGLTVNDVTGPISFHGTPTLTLGSGGIEMSAATADLTLHHPVVLGANQTWRVNDGRTLTVNGQISGSVGFTKSGLGALTLAGPNTFSGNVTIFSGPATITNSSALGTGAKSIAITNGTTGDCALHLDGSAEAITLPAEVSLQTSRASGNGALVNEAGHNRIAGPISMVGGGGNTLITVLGGSLALDGTIAANFTSGRTLQLASASTATNEVNGIIQNGSSATSLAIQSGTWLLTNANTHTGATTVSGGTLALSGSLASALTVNGGLFAPRGTPSVTGAVAVNATSVFQVRLNGPTVGAQHDQLTASGNVTLAGGLDLIPGPGLTGGSTFRILNKASAGSISGSFAGRPAGSTFVEDGYTWTISYTGGDGNDVTVTLATAPQAWRFAHFGTTANSGNAADQFDANGDGESNLLEFATAQNPHAATKATAKLLRNGNMLEYTYPRSVAAMASGVTFAVEWHDTLAPSGWSTVGVTELVLSDNGTVQQVRARLPRGTTGSRFVRLRIVQP